MNRLLPILSLLSTSTFAFSVGASAQGQPARDRSPPGQSPPKRSPMFLPQSIVLPRGDRKVTIDGDLADWPELPALILSDPRQLSGTAPGAWNGPRDLSALGFLLWDEDHLYVTVSVRDEWHRAIDEKTMQLSEIPAADSVLLTFDPNRDTRAPGPSLARHEDREFWLGDEAGREVVLWDRFRGTARKLDGASARCVCLHDKEQGITTYEAKLPWSEILPAGRAPKPGMVIDMQIVVSDYDEATDPMPQTRVGWTFGCGPAIDPALFGSIMLIGDPDALRDGMPEFPPKPSAERNPLGSPESWQDLTARLLRHPPAVHDGSSAPEEAGGLERFAVLEEIDRHCELWPRVDHLEYLARIHRRMTREVAGYRARGLPLWWSSRLRSLSREAQDPVPEHAVRIFRIPMGGWLVGTPGGGFAIDPVGADIQEWLWGRLGFVVLTQPLDGTRRNDQLLLRMLRAKPPRPVLTHIAFHLPLIAMRDMALVVPGKSVEMPHGLRVLPLGRVLGDGQVTASCSYRIEIEEGPRLLVVAPALTPDDLGEGTVDAMILSPYNAQALRIVEKAKPRLVLIDDAFRCQSFPKVPRVRLRSAHELQKALQPVPSILLAPGESWDVRRAE